jgi:hypothetical protein
VSERRVGEHRAQGGEPGVAGAGAVAAVDLEVFEEREDRGSVEVLEVELEGLFADPLLQEAEQQPERVSVGDDRARAGVALLGETVDEERLSGRPDRHIYPNSRTM